MSKDFVYSQHKAIITDLHCEPKCRGDLNRESAKEAKARKGTEMKAKTALLAICVLCAICSIAAAQTLGEKIDAILADPALKNGLQGVVVRSLATNQTLYEHNPDKLMMPASNFKLLVSATALERLGPDYTFATEVYTTGRLNNGVLDGHIIIKGGGDPVLVTNDLTDLARQVKAAGISQINGSVIADESLFDKQRLGWGWGWADLTYYYAAEISALALNRNTVDVYVYPGKSEGAAAEIKLVPDTDYLTIESTATTGKPGSRNTIYVSRTLGQNVVRVGGSIALDEKVTRRTAPVTVKEPGLYAANVFASELAKQGVKVAGSVIDGKTPTDAKLIAAHTSPPLSKILALLNKPSDNLIAETLLKDLGAIIKGRGSSGAGAEVEMEFARSIGMDPSELSVADGSGLSRMNYISASNLVALLSYMRSSKNSQTFIDSLPIAGVDGSLRSRMRGTPAEGNVKAKTGYIARVSSLSGYVNTKSGEPLAFSILFNNHLCRKSEATALEDKICALLADLP